MPTLVSMARSGETFITHDERHGSWLHIPPGAGGAGPITGALAARAVSDHGFVAVNRQFSSWAELDDFRQQEAARFAPPVVIDPGTFDREDVAELLEVARRWTVEGDGLRARRLATQLLRAPVVFEDETLRDGVASLFERLDDVSSPLRRSWEASGDEMKAAAHRRMEDLVPAAA